jgi:hypothetical protein
MLEHGLAARPYDCSRCSLRFFFRAELDNHSYSHLEEDAVAMANPSALLDGADMVNKVRTYCRVPVYSLLILLKVTDGYLHLS